MKSLKIYILLLATVFCFSCKENLDVYNTPDNKLYFDYNFTSVTGTKDTLKRYSFVYEEQTFVKDTLWIDVRTVGFLANEDRAFVLKQVPITANDIPEYRNNPDVKLADAAAGVHYLAFDSPEVQKYMFIPANKNGQKVPLILLRDKSLKSEKHYIKLKIEPNDNFIEGFTSNRYITFEISDLLVQPKYWAGAGEYYFLGEYSNQKLEFMINNSPWGIDEKWFEDMFKSWGDVDMGYCGYLSGYYTNKLIEYNKERKANGQDVLKDDKGEPVRFCLYSTPQPYI